MKQAFIMSVVCWFGRHRWEWGGIFFVSGILLPLALLLTPPAVKQIGSAWTMIRLGTPANRLPGIDARIARKRSARAALVRESRLLEGRPAFSEPAILERIYTASDTIDFTLHKVELGDGITAGESVEIPLEFSGEGDYTAIGKLVETMENLPWTTRVRRLSIAREGDDRGSLSGELLVIVGEAQREGGSE